jgi:hypothetical protein
LASVIGIRLSSLAAGQDAMMVGVGVAGWPSTAIVPILLKGAGPPSLNDKPQDRVGKSTDLAGGRDRLVQALPASTEAHRLGAAGNFAFRVEGTTLFATFEDDGDAERRAQVFRPKQIIREPEWTMAPLSEESRTSSEARAWTKRRRFLPR